MTAGTPTPKTGPEITIMLIAAGMQRAYGDITKAAWRGRLTNADIDRIERTLLNDLGKASEAANEFPGVDAAAAVEKALDELRRFFRTCATARVAQ